jgi:hypothetical protein
MLVLLGACGGSQLEPDASVTIDSTVPPSVMVVAKAGRAASLDSTLTATLNKAVPAGTKMIVAIGAGNTSGHVCSDTGGNTYVNEIQAASGAPTFTTTCTSTLTVALASGDVVTVNYPEYNAPATMLAIAVTGLTEDLHDQAINGSGNGKIISTPLTATTQIPNELLVATVSWIGDDALVELGDLAIVGSSSGDTGGMERHVSFGAREVNKKGQFSVAGTLAVGGAWTATLATYRKQ